MPKAHICRNPFRPQLSQEPVSVRAGTRLDTFLRVNGLVKGRGKDLTRKAKFLLQVNGEYVLQASWTRRIRADDVVTVKLLPGKGGGGSNPLQAVLMIALVAAAVYTGGLVGAAYGTAWGAAAQAGIMIAGGLLINAMLPPPKAQATALREQASPTYSIGAQGNRARLLEAIPAWYGRYRVYPDYAAEPYGETDGNEQYVYQLYCLTQGRLQVERILIEDNDIDTFPEVRYEIVPPGGRVTLFPDNVVTAAAVANLELKGTNEDDHQTLGPYVTNPGGTVVNRIAVDFAWQQGLFEVNTSNKLRNITVTWSVEARPIDDAGNPTGPWFSLAADSFTAATQTPQVRTYRFDVAPARYQVQVRRTSTKPLGTTFASVMHWVGLRGYIPSEGTYGDVTLLAVAIKASNSINQQTQRRINVIGTRMLKVWDPVNGWSADEYPTRNPAWAAADVIANKRYGRGMPDSRQNLYELHRLAQVWDQRGDRFDGTFDTTVTTWEALSRILRVGRALPIYYAGVIDYVRNEPKVLRKAMFSPSNIVAETFSVEYKFPSFDDPDHVIVEIINEDTWQPDEIVCVLPGGTAERPFRTQMPGVTGRAQGWREGISMAAANRDQRKFISLQTDMEGHLSKYGDLVQVSHDVPGWGLSGFVTAYDRGTRTLYTSDSLEWHSEENHYVALRRRDGTLDGPYRVLKGDDDQSMIVLGTTELYVSDGVSEEPTHYQFGPGERRGLAALVMAATPDESGRVALQLTNYAESVHVAEYGGAVPPPSPPSLLPQTPNAPVVDEVTVYASPEPGYQIASATPARGARSYEFQASADMGATWVDLGNPVRPTLQIQLSAGMWRVRGRGIGVMPGPWKVWSGLVSESMAPPPALRALVATSLIFGIRLDWILPDVPWLKSTEILYSETDNLGNAVPLGAFATPQISHTLMGLRAGQVFYFWARLRDVAGIPGPWFPLGNGVQGKASADASLILEYIKGKIEETELGQGFLGRIGKIEMDYTNLLAEVGNNDAAIQDLIDSGNGIVASLGAEARERVAQYQAVVTDLNKLVGEIASANASIIAESRERVAAVKGVADRLAEEVLQRKKAVQEVVDTARDQADKISAVADAVVDEVTARRNAVSGLANSFGAELGALQNDVAGLLGTDEFDLEAEYQTNALTTYDGKLYRAKQQTEGNLPTDDRYWDELGDYSSVVDLVGNLASRMVSVEDLSAAQAGLLLALQTLASGTDASLTVLQRTSEAQALLLTALGVWGDEQGSSISVLQQASLDQASVLRTMQADLDGQGTSITSLEQATAALATRSTTLEASSDENRADIEQAAAQLALLEEVSATMAMQMQHLIAEQGNADAELYRIDIVQADQAMTIERLHVTDGQLTSQIETVRVVTAEHAAQLTTITTKQGTQGSAIQSLQETSLTQAQDLLSLTTRADNTESSVTRLVETSETQARSITELQTEVDGNLAAIFELLETGEAHARRLGLLEVKTDTGSAAIRQLQEVQDTYASQLESFSVVTGTHTNEIRSLTEATAEQALFYRQLKSTVDGQDSTIDELNETTADHAQRLLTLGTWAEGIDAEVSQITRTAEGVALRLGRIEVKSDSTATKVETLEKADAEKAMRLQQLEAEVGNYDASVTDLYIVSEDQARSLLTLTVKGEGYQSGITELRDVSSRHAGRLILVETLAGENEAAVTLLQETTESMASMLSTLQFSNGEQAASIKLLQQVESQVAMQLQQIQAEMGNADASFTELFEVSAGVARQQNLLLANNEATSASIRALAEVVATGDSANATLIRNLTAKLDDVEGVTTRNVAAIGAEETVRTEANLALTRRMDTAFSSIEDAHAAITREEITRTDQLLAFAQIMQGMNAAVGENSISIEDITRLQADFEGKVAGQRSFKMEAQSDGRLVAVGLAMGIESIGGVLQSQMLFDASRFAFINRVNGNTVLPMAIENNQVIINDAIISKLDAAKISFGYMHGDRIAVDTLHANRIWTPSFDAKVASIDTAYIRRANIHGAEVDYLRIAGQSATVWAQYSHGGMYVDKAQANYQLFGFYTYYMPDASDCVVMLNPWQDMASVNYSYSKAYMFRLKHEQTGRIYEGIESASQPRTYGANTGLCRVFSFGRLPAGDQTFTVFVKPDQTAWAGGIPGQSPGDAENPDNPGKVSNSYSTTARFTMSILSAMR